MGRPAKRQGWMQDDVGQVVGTLNTTLRSYWPFKSETFVAVSRAAVLGSETPTVGGVIIGK